MPAYTRLENVRVLGAPIEVHWSVAVGLVLVVVLANGAVRDALLLVASYLGLLLAHEAGHAWVARRLGYQPWLVRISLFHGSCTYSAPDSAWDASLVAWGGVLAQLLLALPAFALREGCSRAGVPLGILGPASAVLGPYSLVVVGLNLLPVARLDGASAWRIVPLLYARARRRRSSAAAQRGRPPEHFH